MTSKSLTNASGRVSQVYGIVKTIRYFNKSFWFFKKPHIKQNKQINFNETR
jgi:hypothetical protein